GRVAYEDDSWNCATNRRTTLFNRSDPGLAAREVRIREYKIGALLALRKSDRCSFVGSGGKDGISPVAKQSARSLLHNWSIGNNKNYLAFDRKGRGMR